MGILSGLKGFGLGNLENMNIFEEEEAATHKTVETASAPKIQEKDFILDKTFKCPVCDSSFSSKVMKTGKAKLLGTDADLRPKYEGIDAAKYDVELCPGCGYTALSRFFPNITAGQAKLIKEKISVNVKAPQHNGEVYSYEEAMERYKLALVCAVVKRGKTSEKAFICLKNAWLLRGYKEYLQENHKNLELLPELEKQELEYLENAFKGFLEARQAESFPICGMDETTVDYLLAVLATRFKKYDVATKLISDILSSSFANNRVKEKTRELKEQILEELRKK